MEPVLSKEELRIVEGQGESADMDSLSDDSNNNFGKSFLAMLFSWTVQTHFG